jgi:multimeric flavodoxin WrbA
MSKILAIYGSPRRRGNTSLLLQKAVQGSRESGGQVEEIFLSDLKISPCLEIYACKKTGRCVIQDDFQDFYNQLLVCKGVMLASPIFFYTVNAHTKILMDRCQALWVKRYLIDKTPLGTPGSKRKGLFISAGATQGKRLFEGTLLSIRYFFDAIDAQLWRSLLYRGLDAQGAVASHPDYLQEAYQAGKDLMEVIEEGPRGP